MSRSTTIAVALTLGVGLAACPGDDTDADPSGTTTGTTGTVGSDGSTGSDETSTTSADDTGSSSGEGESGSTTFGCEQTWYPDVDEDGYGDIDFPVEACLQPPAHILQGGDCDDANPQVHPGVDEVCDMVDNDCNGLVDELSPTNASCQGCELGLMGNHAYYYCPQAMGRPEAQAFCAQLSADLVQFEDQAEQDFVLAEPLPAAPLFYIGLNDLEVEGSFVWPDGTALGFMAWGMGEPNDANMNEDCVQLAVPAGTWNDIDCALAAAFICEAVGF